MEIEIRAVLLFIVVVVTSIELWIVTRRMRRRMKQGTGRKPSDLDLVSFRMWNEVENAEQGSPSSKPIHPR